jgi:hypothetical protein
MSAVLALDTDVDVRGLSDGDILVYNAARKKWIRAAPDYLAFDSGTLTGDVEGNLTGNVTGDVTGSLAAPQAGITVDGIAVGAFLWKTKNVTAALLDSAGSVTVIAGVSGDQYKIRDIRLVGGGTNFAAGGNRLIDLTDGTTVYTTIANADIEAAPATTLTWGNAKVPFLTDKSNIATASGADLVFKYSGGTTDHSGTGSIIFDVLLEKVA